MHSIIKTIRMCQNCLFQPFYLQHFFNYWKEMTGTIYVDKKLKKEYLNGYFNLCDILYSCDISSTFGKE